MIGAHFIDYERKKSGAHVFLEERVMSATFSNERVMSAKLSNEPKKSAVHQFLFQQIWRNIPLRFLFISKSLSLLFSPVSKSIFETSAEVFRERKMSAKVFRER